MGQVFESLRDKADEVRGRDKLKQGDVRSFEGNTMSVTKSRKRSDPPLVPHAASVPRKKTAMIKLARTTKSLIYYFAGALGLYFAWLKLQGLPIVNIINSMSGDLVLRASLIIYYFAWIAGTINDTEVQELIYTNSPTEKGKFPLKGLLFFVLLTIVFGLLCWVDSYAKFGVLLACFLAVNVVGWQYLATRLLPPAIKQSIDDYRREQHFLEAEKVRLVEAYLRGKWQWYRFGMGAVLVAVCIVFSFSRIPDRLARVIGLVTSDFLNAAAFLLFVAAMEGWIWMMRAKLALSLHIIDALGDSYEIRPRG